MLSHHSQSCGMAIGHCAFAFALAAAAAAAAAKNHSQGLRASTRDSTRHGTTSWLRDIAIGPGQDKAWTSLAADTGRLHPVTDPCGRRFAVQMRLCKQCQDLRGWAVSPWVQLSCLLKRGTLLCNLLNQRASNQNGVLQVLASLLTQCLARHLHFICAICEFVSVPYC
ncbi:hypothetical protein LY78DRAFT_441818 [Colletotrichum sublineola]|nr:hypothetical protein LY78DRAFT_441818 [Colletotrichum sublineola]